MDFVKTQFLRIQQQLAGLTASQKMLTAALVAVMAMTLLFWGRFAGTAEMVPLLEQSLSPTELGQIQDRLRARNIPFEPSTDRILVPADRQAEIYADLAYSKALPLNVEAGFDIMVKKLNPWAPATERDAMFNRAKEITCAQIIGLFPDVDHVRVVIDPTKTRSMGAKVEPSANIVIQTRVSGAAEVRKLAEAAGAVVKGAEAALKLDRITVVVGKDTIRLRDPSSEGGGGSVAASASDQLELKQKAEEAEKRKIENSLAYVPGLLVSVNVELDNETVDVTEQTIDGKNTITKDVTTETSETETSEPPPTGEPGAAPNIVVNGTLDVNGAGAPGGPRSREATERTQSQVLPSYKQERRRRGPGEVKVVSAVVRVPQSYFADVLRTRRGPSAAQPDPAEVEQFAEKKLTVMADGVRAATGMAPEAMVTVALYDDVNVPLDATVPQTATMSIPVALGRHGKEIALGALALVSLFMVSMMVKRSTPAAILAAPVAVPVMPPGPLVAGEMLAGEAGTGDAMLDGMELDEDAVKTQQMLEQVSTLVKDNPDAAASLVKRWLNRD